MDKRYIYRYFNGELSAKEEEKLLQWVEKSDENKSYFKKQHELWIVAGMPGNLKNGIADKDIDTEIESIKKKISRNLSERKINKKTKFRRRIYYYAAAAVLAALLFDGFYRIKLNRNIDTLRAEYSARVLPDRLASNMKHVVYTPKGAKSQVTLPDGSMVKLNSDTKLTFPLTFTGPTREVIIDGEGYFDVVSDSLAPMIVNTLAGYAILVKGTKFNVRSYSDDDNSQVTLYDGKIEVVHVGSHIDRKKIITELKPGNSFIKKAVDKSSVLVKKSNLVKEKAWVDNLMIFENTPMKEVITKLERWHGIEFRVMDRSIYDILLTAEYGPESVVQIMESIKFCSGIDYKIESKGKVVILRKK